MSFPNKLPPVQPVFQPDYYESPTKRARFGSNTEDSNSVPLPPVSSLLQKSQQDVTNEVSEACKQMFEKQQAQIEALTQAYTDLKETCKILADKLSVLETSPIQLPSFPATQLAPRGSPSGGAYELPPFPLAMNQPLSLAPHPVSSRKRQVDQLATQPPLLPWMVTATPPSVLSTTRMPFSKVKKLPSYFFSVEIFVRENKFDLALKIINNALSTKSDDELAKNLKSVVTYIKDGDFVQALQIVDNALQINRSEEWASTMRQLIVEKFFL